MRKLYLLVFLVSILTFITGINVQCQFYIENAAIYNDAVQFIDGEEFEEALSLLQMLENKGVMNANISYNIGICYLNQEGLKRKSISYFENATANMCENYTETFISNCAPYKSLLLLGTAYRIDNQIDKAISVFNRFMELSSDSVLIQKAQLNIRQCNVARLMLKNPVDAEIVNLASNSGFPAYNPVTGKTDSEIYYMQKLKFYDAIVGSTIDKNSLSNPENFTPFVGSDGDLILVNSSQSGKLLIFTGYIPNQGSELYYSEVNNNGDFQKADRFPEPINSVFNETGACLAPDGKTLYFSSNRTGGIGGTDIYQSVRLGDGKWSEPKNLGKKVNTPGNETAPYISPDGKALFFSSEGHLNMGGYDFFVSKIDSEGNFLQPENLGSPLSTTDNDLFISPVSGMSVFYAHRNLPGQGDMLKLCKIILKEPLPGYRLFLKGKLNFSDSVPPKQVVYNIIDNKTQDSKDIAQTDNAGNFEQLLPAGSYTVNFLYDQNTTATQQIEVNPATNIDELNIEAPIWKIKLSEAGFVLMIRDILFGFDSYALLPEYSSMLDSIAGILQQFDEIKLEITGHTDSKGSKAYNLALSEKRAQATLNYLLSKGISADRISITAKGKDQPVALNRNSDGTDNALGRKFNRRVTIELRFADDHVKVLKTEIVPEELRIR